MDFRHNIASQISFAPGLLKHYRDANGFDSSDLDARGPFKLSRTDPFVSCVIECGNSSINLAGNASIWQNCSTNNPSGLSLPAAAMAKGKTGGITAEQWVELHQQLLIFKCIAEGVSIPPAMVMALRSSVSGLSRACRGLAAYNALTSNLGNQTSMADPEPNRCRRTDGKKWRCAKEVVPDQKYCEKHMNRGRNRARKSMQPSSNTAPPSLSPTSMLHVPKPSYETSTVCKPSLNTAPPAALNICIPQQPIKNLSPSFPSFSANNLQAPAAAAVANRLFPARNLGLSPQLLPSPFKQNVASILNHGSSYQPKPLISSDVSEKRYPTQTPFPAGVMSDSNVHPFWQFFDVEDDKISRGMSKKGLSIFTPRQIDYVAASSTGSAETVKMDSACLKLSMECDGMDLSMGSELSEDVGQHQKWVPISWEANVGGPLGEVLQSSTPHSVGKGNIGLNLLGEGWDGSPQASSGAASPTDVLHKPIFGSYSDSSSSASSPSRSIKPACSSAVLN